MVVIGIKHFHQVTGQVLLLYRFVIFAFVKMVQFKRIDGFRVPDPQAVDYIVAVTYYREIHRHCQHGLISLLDEMILAVFILDSYITAELNGLCILRAAKLKRITVLKPHIRRFHLSAVDDLLLEHTVMITDTAAISRIAKGSQRIQKTCRQTSQAAVAQRRIRLLVFDYVQIQTDLFQSFFYFIIKSQINQIIAKGTAH